MERVRGICVGSKTKTKQNKIMGIFSEINKDMKTRTREVIVPVLRRPVFGVQDIKYMKLMFKDRKAKQ